VSLPYLERRNGNSGKSSTAVSPALLLPHFFPKEWGFLFSRLRRAGVYSIYARLRRGIKIFIPLPLTAWKFILSSIGFEHTDKTSDTSTLVTSGSPRQYLGIYRNHCGKFPPQSPATLNRDASLCHRSFSDDRRAISLER